MKSIILSNDDIDIESNLTQITIKNSETNKVDEYLVNTGNRLIYKILTFNGTKCTIEFSDHILEPNEIKSLINFDPRLLLLNALLKLKMFVLIDNLINSVSCSNKNILREIMRNCDMKELCDHELYGDELVYRINKQKTLNWLNKKVTNVYNSFMENNYNRNFKSLLRLSISLFEEFLNEDLIKELCLMNKIEETINLSFIDNQMSQKNDPTKIKEKNDSKNMFKYFPRKKN